MRNSVSVIHTATASVFVILAFRVEHSIGWTRTSNLILFYFTIYTTNSNCQLKLVMYIGVCLVVPTVSNVHSVYKQMVGEDSVYQLVVVLQQYQDIDFQPPECDIGCIKQSIVKHLISVVSIVSMRICGKRLYRYCLQDFYISLSYSALNQPLAVSWAKRNAW